MEQRKRRETGLVLLVRWTNCFNYPGNVFVHESLTRKPFQYFKKIKIN